MDCGEFAKFAKITFSASFIFSGLDKNSRQSIDCKRFIAIHVSRKDLHLHFLAHFLGLHKDSVFQRTYEARERDSPEPLAAAGMTTSGVASSALRQNIPVSWIKQEGSGSHAKSVRQR